VLQTRRPNEKAMYGGQMAYPVKGAWPAVNAAIFACSSMMGSCQAGPSKTEAAEDSVGNKQIINMLRNIFMLKTRKLRGKSLLMVQPR
jgi:hypothetical protein